MLGPAISPIRAEHSFDIRKLVAQTEADQKIEFMKMDLVEIPKP